MRTTILHVTGKRQRTQPKPHQDLANSSCRVHIQLAGTAVRRYLWTVLDDVLPSATLSPPDVGTRPLAVIRLRITRRKNQVATKVDHCFVEQPNWLRVGWLNPWVIRSGNTLGVHTHIYIRIHHTDIWGSSPLTAPTIGCGRYSTKCMHYC